MSAAGEETHSASPEITVLFRVKVKTGRVEEFFKFAGELARASRDEPGCVSFTYHQSVKDAADFFLYEQWQDQAAVNGHLAGLIEQYGAPEEGGFLPKALTDYWDNIEATKYRVVE